MTLITKWLRHATPADMRRLRSLPAHVAHSAILDLVADRRARGRRDEGRPPRADEERIMFKYAKDVAALQLEAYLVYRKPQDALVVVDCLYSPYQGQGHATELLKALECRAGGKTVAMMATADSKNFFAKRGYSVAVPCAPPARLGLADLLLTKYVWNEL